MTWYKTTTAMGDAIVIRVLDDTVESGLASHNPDYLAWIAEGNTPQEWPPT